MIEIGKLAPKFELQAIDGIVNNTTYNGKWLVLYFYPKDDTPGCTTEACSFRDNYERLTSMGVEVLGISPDSVASHQKFLSKYNLNFKLGADENHIVAEAFGAWGEKSMYGKKYMGIIRSTFIIDDKGIVRWIDPKVSVKGHVDKVIKALEELKVN